MFVARRPPDARDIPPPLVDDGSQMQAGRIVGERLAGARHGIEVVEVVAGLGVQAAEHMQDPRMELNRGVIADEAS